MSDFRRPASSSARRNACVSNMMLVRSGVFGPSDNPTPTAHTRRCTGRKAIAGTRADVDRPRWKAFGESPRPAGRRGRTLRRMRIEDMSLISVDDHVVEPPDVFEHHLPAKYKDIAPRIEHMPDGTDRWVFLDFNIPNVGLNAVAGRPPEE